MTLIGWMVYAFGVSALIAIAAWSADHAMARGGLPRRGVWIVALILSLGIPALTLIEPAPIASTTSMLGMVESAGAVENRGAAIGGSEAGRGWVRAPLVLVDRMGDRISSLLARVDAELAVADGWAGWIAGGWGAGSIGLIALLLFGGARMARRLARWPVRVIRGRTLRIAPDFGPAVAGVLRPEIVLPSRVTALRGEELELILRHEEAHLRARDPSLLLLGLLPLLLLPWNPMLWWQFRRLRDAVELDCDRRVLREGVGAAPYGSILLRLGARGSRDLLLATALGGSRSLLERRLGAMRQRGRRVALPLALAGGIAAVGLLAVACQAEVPVEAPVEEARVTEVRLGESSIVLPTGAGSPESEPDPTPEPPPQPPLRILELPYPGQADSTSELTRILVAEAVRNAAAAEPRDEPVFTPFTVQPEVRNRADVQRALEREYPPLLRDAGIGGLVIVHLYIAEDGRVQNALIAEPSGNPQLDDAALRVAHVFQFTPAMNQDAPTAVWVQIPINFQSR